MSCCISPAAAAAATDGGGVVMGGGVAVGASTLTCHDIDLQPYGCHWWSHVLLLPFAVFFVLSLVH